MVLWVDADACPVQIKEILFRAAERAQIETVLVANHALRVPKSRYIRALQVESGFDVADARILKGIAAGDLVVTADVPLAARVVSADAFALNPRGTLYTADNVADHLSRRDLMDEIRSSGTITRGPPALNNTDIKAFANELDKFLTRHVRDRNRPNPTTNDR
ncbi:MAG TPA: YaiI/YqxD family protein [Gammaproteobacteria bacterium]|nr:YaiI/YqxD family protein [Gammaproteobacteria bacterium]